MCRWEGLGRLVQRKFTKTQPLEGPLPRQHAEEGTCQFSSRYQGKAVNGIFVARHVHFTAQTEKDQRFETSQNT